MKDIDAVLSNVQSARQEALLYVFEDNEAVIKTIIKGRSPTMRHVSRTHRAALDCLFDRINLDPKIQIKYVDTKNQLAHMLTKGSFTRDEWDDLLRLLNIMNFSISSCSHFFQTEGRVSKPRVLRRARLKKVRQWRNRDRCNWCQGTSSAQRKSLHKIRVLRTARGIKIWIRVLLCVAPGNWCETFNQDPTAHSQEWRQDDTPSCATRKLVWSGESPCKFRDHQETGARR